MNSASPHDPPVRCKPAHDPNVGTIGQFVCLLAADEAVFFKKRLSLVILLPDTQRCSCVALQDIKLCLFTKIKQNFMVV